MALPSRWRTIFPGETFRVLKEREIRDYGEYRTQRLVLEAWDRLGLAPRRIDYHQRRAETRDDNLPVAKAGASPAGPAGAGAGSRPPKAMAGDGKVSAMEGGRPAPQPVEV